MHRERAVPTVTASDSMQVDTTCAPTTLYIMISPLRV